MINVVTALQCEAKPLIGHFRLKGENSAAGFRLYHNEQMRLIVTGVGKLNSAAACAYLYARFGEVQDEAWLNLGIAGHATEAVGSALLMQKISDQGSGLSWYPPLLFDAPCDSATCLTVERPCNSYPASDCVEMEAAGFCAASSRFASTELIHCLKIISDNRANPAARIDEPQVVALLEARLPLIGQLIEQLQGLADELRQQQQPSPALPPFLAHWRFSRYQQNRLQQLLQRWQALQPQHPPSTEAFATCRDSKAVLQALQQQLDAMPIHFGPPG